MSTITVQDIECNPSDFFRRVQAGEAFLVVEGNRTLAEVRPTTPAAPQTIQPRPFGLCAGQFTVPADFDSPLPDEILKGFDGK